MTERPRPLRAHKRPSRWQIALRRVIALIVLIGGFALAWWSVSLALESVGDDSPPPTTTTRAAAAAPKPLRIVFPEGFTRTEMAQRITAVNRIAKQTRKVTPKLSAKQYLALTAKGTPPAGFGRGPRSCSGFWRWFAAPWRCRISPMEIRRGTTGAPCF